MPRGAPSAIVTSWRGISKPQKDAFPGLTNMAIATATVFRSTRRALRSATRIWAGKIPVIALFIRTAHWSKARRRSVSCRAMSTMRGCAWPRCSMHSASRTVRRRCARKQLHCSNASMQHSGTKSSASMPMRSMAKRRKCCQLRPTPDTFTGWGIRTLSGENPAFNPYNYQTGSVWPHDNGFIAMGFKLYGFCTEAAQIAHDISKAASYFRLNQLPELYTAFPREETNFPVQYIGANVPQAWAAGSAFMLTQALLGFLPDAPRNKLYID